MKQPSGLAIVYPLVYLKQRETKGALLSFRIPKSVPAMSPTSSMSSHPENASLTLRSRAHVDVRLFFVIWNKKTKNVYILLCVD